MRKHEWNIARDIVLSVLILAAASRIGFFFRQCGLHATNVVVVYIFPYC